MVEQRFSRLLKCSVTPFLKDRGFKKTRESYIRERGQLSWYLGFQRSRWDTSEKLEFTMNCGVFVPEVVARYVNRPQKQSVSLTDCCLYVRIGMLADAKTDLWWSFLQSDEETGDQTIAIEIQDAIQNLAMPFLEQFDTREAVVRFLLSPPPSAKHINPMNDAIRCAYAGILCSILGDAENQKRALCRAATASRNSPIEDHIASLRKIIEENNN